jgi:hypothetical protein
MIMIIGMIIIKKREKIIKLNLHIMKEKKEKARERERD